MDRIKNVKRYLAMRAEKPMRQLGDGIHTVNAGSEWEGELRLSDLQALMASHDALLAALQSVEDVTPDDRTDGTEGAGLALTWTEIDAIRSAILAARS